MHPHELALIVINDGYGDQCRMSYKARLSVAQCGLAGQRAKQWLEMVIAASYWNRVQDDDIPQPTVYDFLYAARDLEEYYAQHLKELSPGGDIAGFEPTGKSLTMNNTGEGA